MELLILPVLTSQVPSYILETPTASGEMFSSYHEFIQQMLELYQPKEKNDVGREQQNKLFHYCMGRM